MTDAELLLRLYEKYQLETPQYILGPFAWILWDERHRRLVAARDRLGTRSIQYLDRDGMVLLAENTETLLAALSEKPRLNPLALLLHIHGLLPPAGDTVYEGLKAVKPGEILVVTQDRIESRTYWQPESQDLLDLPNDEAYASAFLDRTLPILAEYAPEKPAGITLSSGIDSTTVAAILRIAAPRSDLTAFVWTAPELPEADESHQASSVARSLGLPWVSIPADQLWPLHQNPAFRLSAEGPLLNLYADVLDANCQRARERGIQVLFTGFGGDSLFGEDVFSYPDLLLTGRWRRLVRELQEHLPHSRIGLRNVVRRMILGPIAKTLVPALDRRRKTTQPVSWLGPALREVPWPQEPDLPRWILPGRRERLRVLREPFLPAFAHLNTSQAARHGIDLRHPLIDHRMIEFALSLPTSQTFAAAQRKIIVRNAMRGILPAEVVERRNKIYASAIAHRGLRERETEKVWDLITGMRSAEMGFVEEECLQDHYRSYLAGHTHSTLFWQTLTLEAWLRRYFP